MGLHHLATTSAGLLLAGGGMAYWKANSLPSLIGSAALATSFLGSTYLFTQTDHIGGAAVLSTVGGAATAAMGYKRYLVATKKTVPVTLMVIGALNVMYYGYQAIQFKGSM
ncbi:hypothetical protein BESB_058830 [Besnoitia besnoiti]|uniref:Transmembrane protein 14C n=1 Tax=Besnoitia besnoiti TaxID=94643 RepID=A0A2A9MG99_BESBE|nr:hypothetical protein BESB_058830 [Besnoitia besnoiti]PFH34996.1 hypothetical protein BESB_058830 [Besnoitia besnoiti]